MASRPTGRTKDAGFQIGVSRTLAVPPERLWEFVTGSRGLELWLGAAPEGPLVRGEPYRSAGGASGEVRGRREGERLRVTRRIDGEQATTLQFSISTTPSGTRLALHEERLPDAAARERRRTHWQSVMDSIAAAVEHDA
ncbi:SRPBCC domain-containing protein [Nocardiopsis coralliicola]